VDTPTRGQLIASKKTVEEIRDYIGADSLAYLSLEGLRLACGERPGEPTTFCTSCYTGKYPTDWVEVHDIKPAEKECAVVTTTP
jgi:amidophosphoribosyltransferase